MKSGGVWCMLAMIDNIYDFIYFCLKPHFLACCLYKFSLSCFSVFKKFNQSPVKIHSNYTTIFPTNQR